MTEAQDNATQKKLLMSKPYSWLSKFNWWQRTGDKERQFILHKAIEARLTFSMGITTNLRTSKKKIVFVRGLKASNYLINENRGNYREPSDTLS